MKVVKGLFLFGLGAAAGAAYFFDNSKGKDLRRNIKKQWEKVTRVTNSVVEDGGRQAKTIASSFMKSGTSEWIPSPRFAGALGSVLTVYSAGRRGPAGAILRILSLGLFVRSFMALNNGNSNIKERPESQKIHPSSTLHAETR
jgi:hypothetical protein